MLVLSGKKDDEIFLTGGIEVKILDIRGDKVRLGFTAPKDVKILRSKLLTEEDKKVLS